MQTEQLLDALKARYSLKSDYAAGKMLGKTTHAVRLWRRGTTCDAQTAIRICHMLDIDPGETLADIQAERAATPEVRAQWIRIAETLRQTAAFFAVAGVISLGALADGLYILCKIARKRADTVSPDETAPAWADKVAVVVNAFLSRAGYSGRAAAATIIPA